MTHVKKLFVLALLVILGGCQLEIIDPTESISPKMKTVTLSAGINTADTKASLDSETGAFSWQSGDLISVLATDGNFYDFILESGASEKIAKFVGSIPKETEVTTVASYPRIAENGTSSISILNNNTLNYVLPSELTYAKDVSNVPMVASFETGADHMSFKQVGGVMRFPVKNLPMEASFVVTMNDKTITGSFPVDLDNLGNTSMVAGTEKSVLTINYSSDKDGVNTDFNVPVPTGVYNNFKVEVKDADGTVLFSKDYSKNNTVNRATLLIMKEITLPERPMVISEVWPFFVDARVVFTKSEGVSQYAAYVDGAEEPVILDAEDWGNNSAVLVGGTFSHNTKHTVAVAKVVDGTVIPESKSEAVEFTTADIRQLTTNTGTKFVSVGWDDVAVGWGPKYENGKWTPVSKTSVPNSDLKLHQRRGYQVKLYAASDLQKPIYDFIPFDGHAAYTNPFSDSSWLGKVDGENIIIPTALSFGYLEPGEDYYFRVKTLDKPVSMDINNGNYNPDGSGQPYPYILLSERGGCGWSQPVKLSTDSEHVSSTNELLYEGFDDIQIANDYMNWAPGVVPDLQTVNRQSWGEYYEKELSTAFPEFLTNPSVHTRWNAQAFAETMRSYYLGINPEHDGESASTFNESAGSLNGWTISGTSEKRTAYPIFGAVRLGQSGSNKAGASLRTPALNSDKLLNDVATKCVITVQVAYCGTTILETEVPSLLWIKLFRDGNTSQPSVYDYKELYKDEYSELAAHLVDKNNYVRYQRYYEIKHEAYLKKGDMLIFEKPESNTDKGFLVIGEIKIEAVPGAYEDNAFVDNGVGTAPDDTDYDVFRLGEFPISYWWNIPTAAHNYDPDKTRALYRDMADAGINVVNYNGELDGSLQENIRIMNVCTELGMKFIGGLYQYGEFADQRIADIKQYLATSDTYVGEWLADEPNASKFDELGDFTKRYLQEIPNKEVYINLFPMYARIDQTGSNSYEEHIDDYLSKIPTKSISYDFYPLYENLKAHTLYYTNLDLVRSKTLAMKKPFWSITQTGNLTSRGEPTEKVERWTVWSTIAGGSKGIAYFCYWDPALDSSTTAMINRDGSKTKYYNWIKQINTDINTIGKKLLPCHADGLIMTSTTSHVLYDNNGAGRSNYGPISNVSGSKDVICGCFRDARTSEAGDNYKGYKVLVVGQFATYSTDAYLTLDQSVSQMTITVNNITKTVNVTNTLDETVDTVQILFDGSTLTIKIPEGEAALLEF